MTKVGDYWCMSFPNGYSNVIFNQGNNTDQSDPLAYGGGTKFYNHTGTINGRTLPHARNNYIIPTLRLKRLRRLWEIDYPNGKDYVDAVPYDKTILLDPTWDGVITDPLTSTQEETSISSWNGQTDNGLRKIVDKEITQRIVGLDNSKTYTVQAIVRGWGEENNAKISLKVGEGEAQSFDFVNASAKSYVNKNGRVDDRYTEGPDPDDENISPSTAITVG